MSNTVERKKVTEKKSTYSECRECGRKFAVKRNWQKFCTSKCGFRSWAKTHPRIAMPVAGRQATREAETGTA